MILLEGCVQPAMAPNINAATARVLDAFGITPAAPGALVPRWMVQARASFGPTVK